MTGVDGDCSGDLKDRYRRREVRKGVSNLSLQLFNLHSELYHRDLQKLSDRLCRSFDS